MYVIVIRVRSHRQAVHGTISGIPYNYNIHRMYCNLNLAVALTTTRWGKVQRGKSTAVGLVRGMSAGERPPTSY
jgi:hypothetical protein